jgi:hypothetical protein
LWGFDALINLFADRRSPTRFANAQAATTPGPLRGKYREMLMDDLSRSPPLYIFLDADSVWPLLERSGSDLLNDFPQLHEFLSTRYRFVTTIGGFQVWHTAEPLQRGGNPKPAQIPHRPLPPAELAAPSSARIRPPESMKDSRHTL